MVEMFSFRVFVRGVLSGVPEVFMPKASVVRSCKCSECCWHCMGMTRETSHTVRFGSVKS